MALKQALSPTEILEEKIKSRSAVVAVIGLGYVGLPLAVEKAKIGFKVIGIEQNAERQKMVNDGQNYISDVKQAELAKCVETGNLSATTDFSSLAEADIVIICVPTPLSPTRDPDISYVISVTKQIAKYLHAMQLVVLESTSYPGTTEDVVLPILAKRELTLGNDYFVAYSPERVDPGNKRYSTKNTSKLVGGATEKCLKIARTFYDQTITNVHPVNSPKVAEMTKVFENTFRAVNIALVNELALLCDKMDISIWEVIEAAETKPFGMMTFYPGPGVGGHCIPVDPFFLTYKARQYDFHTRFIELAGEINLQMPYFVVKKITRVLNQAGKCLKNSKILVLGIAYKKDIDDARMSPAITVIEALQHESAEITYNDPFIPSVCIKEKTYTSKSLVDLNIKTFDCVVLLADHTDYPYEYLASEAISIVDTRNAFADFDGSHIVRL